MKKLMFLQICLWMWVFCSTLPASGSETCRNSPCPPQAGQSNGLNVYQVYTASTHICHNQSVFITLVGSDPGVTYYLQREDNGEVISEIEGNGDMIAFDVVLEPGVYNVSANGALLMAGTVRLSPYPLFNALFRLSEPSITFTEEGGTKYFEIQFIEDYKEEYTGQLLEIIDTYNSGSIKSWNNSMQLAMESINGNVIRMKIEVVPNILNQFINSLFRLDRFNSEEMEEKVCNVSQRQGPGFQAYDLLGPEYVSENERYTLRLSNYQAGVWYRLFCNGYEVQSNSTGIFSNLQGIGVYHVEGTYNKVTLPMKNKLTVRRKEQMKNSVAVSSYINETGDYVEDVSYFDAFGRKIQDVAVAASPLGHDLVSIVEYDAIGRLSKNYLPYPETTSWYGYNLNDKATQNTYYSGLYGAGHYAYSQVRYDNTPQDNIREQSAPGASWRLEGGHSRFSDSRKNLAADQVKFYRLDGSSVTLAGTWPVGSLAVKLSVDPEKKEIYDYYDAGGRLVAKEVRVSTTEKYHTYYVYDGLGLMRYTIPPAQDALFTSGTKTLSELSRYCYYNEYDKNGRIYKQYVPGAQYTIYLYDKRGRLALSQDARQRSLTPQEWSFTKYDIRNRPVITGICQGTEATHANALSAAVVFGEDRGGTLHGYTNRTYPAGITPSNCLVITYYDDYAWDGQEDVYISWDDLLEIQQSTDVNGHVTGTKTKILGITGDQWLLKANYYDSQYRFIQQVGQFYPSGLEVVTNMYDFTGKVIRAKVKQSVGNENPEYNKYFTYDRRGRLLKVAQRITGDSQGKVTIASYNYDAVGCLQGKKWHNNSYGINYSYSVGGQLTQSTSPDLTYQLSYDELPVASGGATAKYDGNISCFRWKNKNGLFKAYTYAYDGLGQLVRATYNEQTGTTWSNPSGKYNVGSLAYDPNGNIRTLVRNSGSGTPLHNLAYDYNLSGNGNAPGNISLNGSRSGNFLYDPNGNLQSDGLTGQQIEYNQLNLPRSISINNEKIYYIYSAIGEKLAMQAGNSSLTYYRGAMVYSGNNLSHILHPEGLVRKSGTGWVYNYLLRDHVGSTRVLLEANGSGLTSVQTTDYYPFGLSFANNNLNLNKYLFSGKELQDATLGGSVLGLYDFGSRFYNPVLGRWFSQDPALQLMSPYGYCGNNPVRYIDPDGEFILGYLTGFLRGLVKGDNPFKKGWQGGVNEEKIRWGLFAPDDNQNLWQKMGEIVSRFTWQLPQTLIGYGMSQFMNYTSSTEVDYYGGTTTVSSGSFKKGRAITLGNFINGGNQLKADPNTSLFQHEYGHYLQSKKYGWGYLSKVGFPSLLSAGGKHDDNHPYYTVEQDANARAIKYLNKRGDLNSWDFDQHPIGMKRWSMTSIYQKGTTEFTDEFNTALNNAYTHSSFWDFISVDPLSILIRGTINHKRHEWINETTK